jgi:CDP-2,3-bis-(O-geranylgeranyl)-sn-glycerol synthase
MAEFLLLGPKVLYFFLPVAFANMAPVLFQHIAPFLAKPIDGGRSLGGKRVFGDHKTWRGLIFATLAGGCVFLLQVQLVDWVPTTIGWSPFDLTQLPLWFGFVFGFGAIAGDAIESFAKRRFAVAPGQPWFPFDQIDFLLGSTIAASVFVSFSFAIIIWVFGAGILAHMLVNRIGYWLKLEDSKW